MQPPSNQGEITELLNAWNEQNEPVRDQLIQLIYPELKAIARRRLAAIQHPITLDSVDLLHEAYFRLVDQNVSDWQNRRHFFCVAARLIRRVLLDHIRWRSRERRGGSSEDLPLEDVTLMVQGTDVDLIDLDHAIQRLEGVDELAARIVELRYFAGMGHTETAETLSIGRATVGRRWRFAKAFLAVQLQSPEGESLQS